MRSFLTWICVLMLAGSVAFAQCPSSNKCSAADKAKSGCCPGAKMTDARMAPQCAPQQVKDFHKVLVPFMEARSNSEPSYIRDNARYLYTSAKAVGKSKPCCNEFDKKAFKGAAKDLKKDAGKLEKLAKSKKAKDDEILAWTKVVEDDYVKLTSLCDVQLSQSDDTQKDVKAPDGAKGTEHGAQGEEHGEKKGHDKK